MSLFEKLGRRTPTESEWNEARQGALDEIEEESAEIHTRLFRASESKAVDVRELLATLEALTRYARTQISNLHDSLKPGSDLEEFRTNTIEDAQRRPR